MRHIQIYKNIVYVFSINLNLEKQDENDFGEMEVLWIFCLDLVHNSAGYVAMDIQHQVTLSI